jgi:hypothetical protein
MGYDAGSALGERGYSRTTAYNTPERRDCDLGYDVVAFAS